MDVQMKNSNREISKSVPYIVYNLPKKSDSVLQSDIQSILELHYGVSPSVHIHTKVYGCVAVKYASFKLISPPDPHVRKLHEFCLDSHHLLVCPRDLWDFDKSCYHDQQTSCIWMYKLPKETTEEAVWQLFQSCGSIKFLFLVRDDRKGIPVQGFVQFWDHESLLHGLELDKQLLFAQPIRLKEFNSSKCLYVNNLHVNTDQKQIEDLFCDLSPMHVCFSSKSHSARVYFAEESSYLEAFTSNRRTLNGIPVSISSDVYSVTRHVYVTSLPPGISTLDLKEVFDWNVKSIKKCNFGITKLTFKNSDTAEAALKVPNPVIKGINITLYSDFTQATYALQHGPKLKSPEEERSNSSHKQRNGDSCSYKGNTTNTEEESQESSNSFSGKIQDKEKKRKSSEVFGTNMEKPPKLPKVLCSFPQSNKVKKVWVSKKEVQVLSSVPQPTKVKKIFMRKKGLQMKKVLMSKKGWSVAPL